LVPLPEPCSSAATKSSRMADAQAVTDTIRRDGPFAPIIIGIFAFIPVACVSPCGRRRITGYMYKKMVRGRQALRVVIRNYYPGYHSTTTLMSLCGWHNNKHWKVTVRVSCFVDDGRPCRSLRANFSPPRPPCVAAQILLPSGDQGCTIHNWLRRNPQYSSLVHCP